ncbi:MAG: hypothetical protein ACRC35_06570 [Angustibacter sp.]
MDASRVHALRDALRHTDWWRGAVELGRAVRHTSGPGRLLLVGTPRVEPWHLAAHLDDEARLSGQPHIAPQLVRWCPPPGAPAHLAIGLERLERAERGETVLVVAPDSAPDRLLERVADARRTGVTVLSVDAGDHHLGALAHERVALDVADRPPSEPSVAGSPSNDQRDANPGALGVTGIPDGVLEGAALPPSFELAQHVLSGSAGRRGQPDHQPSWQSRLGRIIDLLSGPHPR